MNSASYFYVPGFFKLARLKGDLRMMKILTFVVFSLLLIPTLSLAENADDVTFGFFVDRLAVWSQSLVFNEKLISAVERIGNKMASASEKPFANYTFRVINDPIINAYSAAGGYIYVNTGLLDILESEDELAAILGHEIAHTNNNHQLNSVVSAYRSKITAQAAGIILSTAISIGLSYGTSAAFGAFRSTPAGSIPYPGPTPLQRLTQDALSEVGSQVAGKIATAMAISMVEGYGREKEIEADTLAVKNMHKAGYDPNAFIGIFKKLISIRETLGSKKDNYMSNLINAEPGLEERIRNVEELVTKSK